MSVAVDLRVTGAEPIPPMPLREPGGPAGPGRHGGLRPGRQSPPRSLGRTADGVVVPLYEPSPASIAAPLRLTRRGVVVLAVLTMLVSALLVWVAWVSRPAPPLRAPAPATVTVQTGDTLWSIAGRIAPGRSPIAEIATLQRLNHLGGTALVPGQVLRTR